MGGNSGASSFASPNEGAVISKCSPGAGRSGMAPPACYPLHQNLTDSEIGGEWGRGPLICYLPHL